MSFLFTSFIFPATQISEEEFSHWYLESEEYILSKVKPFFYTFDVNNSGSIERNKIEKLLKTLEPRVAGDEITAMLKTEHIEGITYDEFVDWAVHSMAYFQRQSVVEAQVKEESPVTCDALSPPRGQGFCAWALYLLVLPLMAALTFTIPDVRRPGYGKWCYVSLVVSITLLP